MTAATGIVLKVSMKFFHSLSENLRLPVLLFYYTHRRSRRVCLSRLIRGSREGGRNLRGI